MRARTLLAGLALGLAGCSLLIDPEGVPRPSGCVSTGCAAVACGSNDNCGNLCAPGSGCIPAAGAHRVEGGITGGAAAASPAGAHGVRGELSQGAQHAAASGTRRIEQGTLR